MEQLNEMYKTCEETESIRSEKDDIEKELEKTKSNEVQSVSVISVI
jgi:hypothetical protein